MTGKPMGEPTSELRKVEDKIRFRSLRELPGEKMLAEGITPPDFVPDATITKGDYLLVIYDPEKRTALASLKLDWLNEPDAPLNILELTRNVESRIDESGLGYKVGDYYVEEGKLNGVEVDDAHDLGVDYSSAYKASPDLDTD